MFRNEIRLDTITEINELVNIASSIEGRVTIEDGNGHCVNAKSLLGVMYASGEFERKYIVSERDITYAILRFIV